LKWAIWFLWSQVLRVSVNVETRQVMDYSRQLQLLRGTIENGSQHPDAKGAIQEEKKSWETSLVCR
jgi:hypothetical protein